MERSFTVDSSSIGVTGGRYKSKVPSSAAKKAASKLFAKKNTKSMEFQIRETTRGSDKQIYAYKAIRETLAKPLVRVIAGKEVVNRYKIVLTENKK